MHNIKKTFARNLRHESTPEEKKVWNALRNRKFLNCKFRRQHVIEVDGNIHERQKEYDELRQRLIEEKGIKFIRITNEEVNKDINILFRKMRES